MERSVIDPMGENASVAAIRNAVVLFYIIAPALLLKLSSHFGGEGGAALSDVMGHGGRTADESANTSLSMVKNVSNILMKG